MPESRDNVSSGLNWTQAVALPGVFVFLWSTGFVVTKIGIPYAGPFTFLELRYALATGLLALIALVTRAPWPNRASLGRIAVGGLLLHGGYLGGVFLALALGVEAGAIALIAGLQPILTAALAGPVLGEAVTARQWSGLALGLAGVTLVVRTKLAIGLGTPAGMGCAAFAMLSFTCGTLWQKRFGGDMDLRTGTCVQYSVCAVLFLPLAWLGEHFRVTFAWPLLLSLAWLCLVLSIVSVFVLYVLIRRGAASKVASLLFLVPPTTALMAWPLFGETFDRVSLLGMAMVIAAVALVTMRIPPRAV